MNTKFPINTSVFTEVDVPDIAREVIKNQETDDAFFICDLSDLEYKVKLWSRELPRVTPYFAMKSCPDPIVLRTLNRLGVNFDCSNKVEMEAVLEMGVTPSRIVYANTYKCSSHLRYALEHGVTLMTFDTAEELSKITDKSTRLLLRIVANDYGSRLSFNDRFGCDLDNAEALLQLARNMSLNVVGISFHVGSSYHHSEIFLHSIAEAKFLFEIGENLGFQMTVLDIGGGFPGGLRDIRRFLEVSKTVRSSIDQYFPENRGYQIIAEPGQFLVSSAFTLVTKVIAIRKSTIHGDGSMLRHQDVIINESIYNCISRDLYKFLDVMIHPLNPPYDRSRDVKSTLWGASCSPLDCIAKELYLFDVNVDDWLLMDNMGAYSIAFASGFNGLGFPTVMYTAPSTIAPSVRQILESLNRRQGITRRFTWTMM